MNIKNLATRIYESNKEAGWHDSPRYALEMHMLIVTEVAEASECVRNKEPEVWHTEEGKPCGEAIEMADVLIRTLDYMQSRGWNIEQLLLEKLAYNKTRGASWRQKKLL